MNSHYSVFAAGRQMAPRRDMQFIGRGVRSTMIKIMMMMILSVAMLVLIIMNFCITFIVVLGMMIGLLFSSWRRFFVSGTMILEYFLVMAEGCQRQN